MSRGVSQHLRQIHQQQQNATQKQKQQQGWAQQHAWHAWGQQGNGRQIESTCHCWQQRKIIYSIQLLGRVFATLERKKGRQNLPQCGGGWSIFREDLAGNQLQSSVPRHCDITPTHHPSTPQHCFLFPSQNQILAGRHDVSCLFQVSFRPSVSTFLFEIESNVTNCWYPGGAISLVNQNLDI